MNIRQIVALSLISMGMLVACSNDEETSKKSANDSKPAVKHIMVSKDGVGPINASTPFNMHQVTLAFPDFNVSEYTQFKQGDETPVIRVDDGAKPMLVINPDTERYSIFSVIISSDKVGNALGHEIGSTFNTIYTYENPEPCTRGEEEYADKVLCLAPGMPNILYLFSGKWDGDREHTPPPGILASWKLESIIWRPVR